MAEEGFDCDLQTDAVPGDMTYEELEQTFQTQLTIQHHDPVTDPRNGSRLRKSSVEKSKTSEEIEALNLQHSNSEADDFDIEKYRHRLPPELQAGFHDGIIEYCEDNDDDEIGAKQFLDLIKTKVVLDGGEAPKVVLFNEMSPGDGTNPVERLDHNIKHCTYKFLYVTESFCKDKMKKHSSATCLTESVYVPEQNYTVVPIFTTDKYSAPYTIPSSIRSLIGVNYYKDNTFPAEKLRRLFQPKVAYRKEQEAVIEQKRIDAVRQMRVDALRQNTAEERRRKKLRVEEMHFLGLKRNLNYMPAQQPWNVGPQKHGLAVGTTSTQVSHALSQNVPDQPSSNKLFAVRDTRADDNRIMNTVCTDTQEDNSTCREVPQTRSDPDGDATERRSTHAADPPPTSTSANAANTFNTTKRPVISSEKADEGDVPNKHGTSTGQAYASVECLHASDLVADDTQHVSKATLTRTPGSVAPFGTQGWEGMAAGKVILTEDTTAVKATLDDENVDSASVFADKDTAYSDASDILDAPKDFCHQQLVNESAHAFSVSEAKVCATVYSRGAGRPPCARAAQGCNVPPQCADHRASQAACARPNSPPPPYSEHVPQHVQQPTVIVHNHYYGKVHNVYGGKEQEPVRNPSEPQPTTVNINIGSARTVMVGGPNQRFTSIDVDSSRAGTTGDHAEEQSVADQEETIGGVQETQPLEPETAWKYADPGEYTPPRSPVYSVRSADCNSDNEDTQSKMAHG